MDIASILPNERIVEILHPDTGESVDITVTLMSLDDERMKKIKRRITDKRLTLERKGKGFDADEIEENTNTLLFSAMTAWEFRNEATFRGEKPAFNQRNVFAVFEALPWFRDQIHEEIAETKAFFRK